MGSLNRTEVIISPGGQHVILLFFLLVLSCLLPTGLFYFLSPSGEVSSGAPGTILVCLVALSLPLAGVVDLPPRHRIANYLSLAAVVVGVILVHFVGSVAVGDGTVPSRALLSIPVLLLMLAGGSVLATAFRQHAASLGTAIAATRWLLIGLALLAILGIHPWPGIWEKPIFPFSEPSHMALVLGPLMAHACVSARGRARILWIVGGFALAYLGESLTLVISMLLTSLICLPISGIVIAVFASVALPTFIDLTYFTSRLNFAADTRNLSSLVYRQGWELLGDAMERTSGWGIGFQQLGYAPFRSPAADTLYSILRDDANTRDGGFLLAKIGSEFGILGIFLVLVYIVIAARSVLALRKYAQRRGAPLKENQVLALCSICGLLVDIFVRDVGYFTTSTLIFVSSLYGLWESRPRAHTPI